MKTKINKKIKKLFEPTLKIIEKQTICEHFWEDKDGRAYFRCKNCGYLADNRQLDRLIFIQKLLERGMSMKMIKECNFF